ncbi:mediator of DNA damage checkpoint protein 1 [Pempheris klunzingeri]|uniref:mediator of DNA damage checkpoint protein 1 n=1 Tax=Pempheris klunzingeri TaxID=3127111 RepID=UPI00397FA508
MDATQMISDSVLDSDEDENEEENENERGRPLAKLCILKNEHIPETELPLFVGDNVLGRDPNTCTLPFPAPSVSKQHATICISAYRRRGCPSEVDIEALVWDLGSMNGTRKGRLKLTPNVRYALSERDTLVVADIPCHYVSCAVDTVSSQRDMRTPVRRGSGVKARLPDASGEKGGDTSSGSKKCVNGGTKAGVSRKTPVRASFLSLEQTPTQPQGTLVPESDSDSDGEKGGGADTRRKAPVSDSDSYKSSPTCSTFLSPTNKIVPESEDESPITPSCSTKNRPHRRVSFSKEDTDVDVGRQQLKEKKAHVIVDDSEERAALEGTKSEESGQHVPVKQESNVSLTREDELPVSAPAVSTDAIPALNMDSDTDMEGEEDGMTSADPVTLTRNQQADQPPNTAQFHMDSDTDIDEDDDADDALDKVAKSADNTKLPHVVSVIQPEGITMDSDTDVDDDDDAVSGTTTKAKPTSCQSRHTADSASSVQLKDFHLNSDTDVDEEEERDCGTNNVRSKIDETATRVDVRTDGPESVPAAPRNLHLDSDTDDEAISGPSTSEPPMVSAVTEPCTTANTHVDLEILSDSDTDLEDNSPLTISVAVTAPSAAPGTTTEALEPDSDANTDVDESSLPPVGDGVSPAGLKVDSDTDVDLGEAGEGQIPSLCRENTPGLLVPLLQHCSTPVQLSGGEVEDMDTQAFLSPSPGPFRRAVAPAVRPKTVSSCSDSQEDEYFVVAETQSFVLQTRDSQGNPPQDHTMDPTQAFGLESSGDENGEQCSRGRSFQLGLSDSSHLQAQAQALAMESTQAFVSVEGGVNLEDTQAYAAISNADGENDSNVEATQAYEEDEKPAGCSVMSEAKAQVNLALEATQAYISEPCCDSDDETDEDERKNTATAETQHFDIPTSSTLATSETQPMSAFEEEESLDKENPRSSVLQVKARPQNERQKRGEHGEAPRPQDRHISEALSVAETQPMHTSDNEDTDDEDLIPGPRKRKAKPLQLEEEQTQPLTSSDLSPVETQPKHVNVDETQPTATSGNEESDFGDSSPGPRKRREREPLEPEEEKTQTLTNSELFAVETQPVHTSDNENTDDEDLIPGPRKRKAKVLQHEDEETQPLTSSEVSAVETQPLVTGEYEESDEEDSILRPRKRKTKVLQIEDEATQPLTCSEVSAVETQPVGMGEDEESDEEDSLPGLRKRKAKPLQIPDEETQSLTYSEASTGETQPLETKAGSQPQREKERQSDAGTSGITVRCKRETRARLGDEEEQAECSELPKRQTRGKNKALPTTRGRRGKQRPYDGDREEEEEVEQAKRARGKKPIRQQKDDDEEERLETERNGQEKLERERKEKDEQERLQAVNAERLKLEQERAEKERLEKERKEQEEKKRADRAQKEKEQLEKEEKERLEREEAERQEKERLEKKRIEKERKEQQEKERLETAKRELQERERKEEQEHQARLEREERERLEKEKEEKEAKEKQIKEQENKYVENEPKAPARGRRAPRRTNAALSTTQPEGDSTISTNDDVPARRTRSRSNSSNSVSSERSASSINSQESRGRGRGRGAKRASEPPQAAIARGSNRRRTVAAEPTEQYAADIPPQGVLSRSSSTNSLSNSEISNCSLSSQGRGRGSRQRGRGRGRKTEAKPDSVLPDVTQSDQNSAPKPTTRGRKATSNEVPHEDDKEKADTQQASTTRGRRQANLNDSEPAAANKEDLSKEEEGCANGESLLPERNVRGRGQKAAKRETVEPPVAPAASDGDEAKEKRKGRKRELEANTEDGPSSSSKMPKGKERAQTTGEAEDEAKGETKDEIPVQAKRRGRASSAQAKTSAKDSSTEVEVKEESETVEQETAKRRGRGRPSAVPKKKKEEQEENGKSADEGAHVEASEPQTPTSSVSRKRPAPVDSSPVAKTPRSSAVSPAASGRVRAAGHAYKVLFTGVVDEAGERVLARLGGSMAKGVADMNCLVTDKVRRTVKFLCAVAKGVPIVTTLWLEKSGKAGSFLPPNAFVVKDPEQEKKFSFCLQESLRTASSQLLLQGYWIHVTKSVKPEPVQMKDIISCSGATYLPKMPSAHKPQTVVISCEEDWPLSGPALSASLPVVTAEFILTGILQQKVDFQTHALSAPISNLQPAGGRGRGRKKT